MFVRFPRLQNSFWFSDMDVSVTEGIGTSSMLPESMLAVTEARRGYCNTACDEKSLS